MPSPKILLLECDSPRVVAKLSMRQAVYMIEHDQAWFDSGGDLRVKVPGREHEHPCRTRISWGGLLAALGMSQVYTRDNQRGNVDDFKRIFPEDRACFNQATKPGGWMIAVVSYAATAFSLLHEAAAFI